MFVKFRSFVIQDVFAEQVFMFSHCEQVSGITYHHCVLTKGFAILKFAETAISFRGPSLALLDLHDASGNTARGQGRDG